jgi:hypothetical protein
VVSVIPLSILAAFLLALAAAYQRAAARVVVADGHGESHEHENGPWGWLAGLVTGLVRQRLWLIGWLVNMAGFLTQAAALHLGSVSTVQALLATQMLFALPLSRRTGGPAPTALTWIGGVVVCVGLAVLLGVRGAAPETGSADRGVIGIALPIAAGAAVLLVASGFHHGGTRRAATLGVAAGIFFALSAVLIKLTTADLFGPGIAHTAADWPGYCLAASTLLGLLLEQGAFASGSLALAVTAMTTTNVTVSYVLGIMCFKGDAPTTAGSLTGAVLGLLIIAAGIAMLSHSHALDAALATEPVADPQEASGGLSG